MVTPLKERPGDGRTYLSKESLLTISGLPLDLEILGVRWNSSTQELMIQVRGTSVPYQGGDILSVNPIITSKQIRDEAIVNKQ